MKVAALLLFALAPALFAQDGTVVVEPVVEGKATPGKEYTLKLRFTVPAGYHAYHKDSPGGAPIEVKWSELSGLEPVDATWPEPKKYTDDFGEEWKLEGTFDIAYRFKVPANARGKLSVSGSHETQFCNAEMCYPGEGDFAATIDVATSKPAPAPVKPGPAPKKNDPEVTAKAVFEGETKAGGEATLNLTFEFTEGYHAYHKDTPGVGLPPQVDWTELSGLTLKNTLWPEPIKHDLGDGDIEWEYESPLTLTYTFSVPADARGDLPVKAKWDLQVCDPNMCFIRKGEFAATLTLDTLATDKAATDSHGFYLDFDYAFEQARILNKPLLIDFNGER